MVFGLAIVGASSVFAFGSGGFDGGELLGSLVRGSSFGIALSATIIALYARPVRRLFRTMTTTNPSLYVVPIRSSTALSEQVAALGGATLGSRSFDGTFVVFVDAGSRFELWRWNQSQPQQVLRVPWSSVSSVEIGTVTHLESVERAILLSGLREGKPFQLELPPQRG